MPPALWLPYCAEAAVRKVTRRMLTLVLVNRVVGARRQSVMAIATV